MGCKRFLNRVNEAAPPVVGIVGLKCVSLMFAGRLLTAQTLRTKTPK